ncbi:hypothetical protein, partial [Cyanophage BHS3]
RRHIDRDLPVIVHGYFTASGHIVCVTGYDDEHVRIHDPYGEWFVDGYQTSETGSVYWMRNETFDRLCNDGGIWTHFFARGGQHDDSR